MNKKQAKRRRDIKTKLMAAICMLLVSSIMMVSTTYAWFTLSTAPEVTGINTAVGANGNLEMALLRTDGDLSLITSGDGDSNKALTERNITWGNLVDLSPVGGTDHYGLTKVVLNPSELNATLDENGNPTAIADLILKTPEYGADGRVSALKPNTTASIFDFASQSFPQTEGYGVRAVGAASGMTDRQLDYRNYRSAAATAMSQAKTYAARSLNVNGVALAKIAMVHGADSSATHGQEDVTALKAIVNDLLGTEGNTGVLQYLENSYINYIVALSASAASQEIISDEAFTALKAAINGTTDQDAEGALGHGTTLDEVVDTYGTVLPENIKTAINGLLKTRQTVAGVMSELNDLTGETITWAQLSAPLNKLANINAMEVNGFAVENLKENIGKLITTMGNGINVTMKSGGGVYADVADHAGDYNAAVVMENIVIEAISSEPIEKLDATMYTASTVNPAYLSVLGTLATGSGAPSSEGGKDMPLSDFYGYIIDMAFRTNAAGSDLLLQVDAVDRIYDDNKATDSETMGHGSSMTFTKQSSEFSITQMKALMGAIRIVFFDPQTKAVVATAKLDVTNTVDAADGMTVTAKMYLYEMAPAVTYDEATAEQKADDTTTLYTLNEGVYTAVEDKTQLDDGTTYYVAVAGAVTEVKLTDNKLMALTQNTPHALSVLVYLDGKDVGNEDVAATVAQSMTGTMNLQFASSANLVPMNYTPLMNQGGNGGTTETTTPANPEG